MEDENLIALVGATVIICIVLPVSYWLVQWDKAYDELQEYNRELANDSREVCNENGYAAMDVEYLNGKAFVECCRVTNDEFNCKHFRVR